MKGGKIRNFDIAIGNFGVEVTVLIQPEKFQKKTAGYVRNRLKEDAE